MKFCVKLTSGGNHGHQLKDYIGGILFGRIFGLEFMKTKSKYLEFTGINRIGIDYNLIDNVKRLCYNYTIKGPYWGGFD